MKDSIALLATAIAMAVLASLFWKELGQDAFAVLGLITTVTLAVDNFRLRRQVKAFSARTLQALTQPLRQKIEVPCTQLRQFVGQVMANGTEHEDLRFAEFVLQNAQVVQPVHRHVRLTLNDQRAACAAWRAFDTYDPLRQRADPGGRQSIGLQRVGQQERQEGRGVEFSVKRRAMPVTKGLSR